MTGWTQVNATSNEWAATLPANTTYFRQLWANGRRQMMARMPTSAYVTATQNSIVFKAGQIPAVPSNLDDVHVVLYESWTASLHQIANIDMAARNITFKTLYNNEVWTTAGQARWMAGK